jgi:hypothetical protein
MWCRRSLSVIHAQGAGMVITQGPGVAWTGRPDSARRDATMI